MHELNFTFLGTGTSHGIPVIACDCAVCGSTDPRDKRLRTSALLRTPEATIAIDTPPDFRQQCLREGVRSLDAVIYTHPHSDHIMGFDDVRRFCEVGNKELPVYGSPATLEAIERTFYYAFGDSPKFATYARARGVRVDKHFSIGATEFETMLLPHGRILTTGLVIRRDGRKRMAYMTDCGSVPEEAIEAARGVDVLVLDALRYRDHSTHLTVEEALEVVARIQPQRTYFIHMCHELSHAETEAKLPPDIRLSYDGLQITI